MVKYLSGRVKRTPQDQLKDDRYEYLNLEQAEPNLADPPTPTSEIPPGSQFQLVSIPGHPGRRYWVPIGGGLIAGAVTIFDEGSQVSGTSSITQLNFVGAAVTAEASVQHPSGHPGIAATVTVIPVTVGDNPPIGAGTTNNGELWWESDTGDLYVYYDDGNTSQWVQANAGGRGLTGNKGDKGEPSTQQGPEGDKGSEGEKGAPGNVLAKGVKGDPGVDGADGSDGSDGDKGNTGDKGEPGVEGDKGEQGIKGQKGEIGAQGDKAGILYNFSNANTMVDPNAGNFRFNSSVLSSVNQISIDALDKNGNDFSDFITTWDDANDVVKGTLSIKSNDNTDTSHTIFQVTSVTDNTGFLIIGVQNGVGNIPSNLETCVLNFSRAGDKGITGDKGVTDKITEGNTEAEVVDTGTDGHFKVTTEGTERFKIDNVGLATFTNDVVISNTLFLNKTTGQICKIDHNGANLDLHADVNVNFFESDSDKLMFTFDVNTTNNDARIIMENDTDTFFNHPDSNQLGFTVGGTETIRLKDGNVGINSISPSQKLSVVGSIRALNNPDAFVQLTSTGSIELKRTDGSFIDFATAGTEDHDCRIKQEDNGLAFTTGGDGSATEKFRFGSSGQLGLAGANYGASGQVLTSQGASSSPTWSTLPSGVTAFLQLNDTPSSFTADKTLKVNGAGNAVIFADDNDTKYDLSVPASTTKIRLNETGTSNNDDVEIFAGTGISVTRNSTGTRLTITNIDTGSSSNNTFIGLTDTPSSFIADKTLKVNGAGDEVIFADDNDTKYDLSVPASTTKIRLNETGTSNNDDVTILGSGSVSVSRTGTNELTIAGTDTNTQIAINNNADNRIITGSNAANTLNAESNLTFDGSVFKINGTGQALLTLRTTDNTADRGIAFQNSGNAYVASINVEDAGSSTGDLVFHVDDVNNTDLSLVEERLRITSDGAFGLNGTNYGTSGQVLTSQGSSSAPIWTTPTDTNTQLSREEVEDFVGEMFSSNTETRITATYADNGPTGRGKINLVVDDMTSDNNTEYELSTSANGSNVELILDPSTGTDDVITITKGDNVSFTNVSSTGFTINTTGELDVTQLNLNRIRFGPGNAINDDANIEWLGGSNNGYLRISTSDDGGAEYIELGDYGSVDISGTFTQWMKLRRSELTMESVVRTKNDLYIDDTLRDKDGDTGSNGQVLTSTGSQVNWVDASTIGGSVDTKYDLLVPSGTTKIRLEGPTSSGNTNDDVEIYAGTGISVTRNSNGTRLTIANTDTGSGANENYYLTALSFNTSNGILTGTVNGASNPTVDLDGRYVLQSTGGTSGVPSGTIVLWSGSISNIPSGWELCDGSNNTPDLRNRFVVGAWSDGANTSWPNLPPGNTGGSNVSSLPAHSHTINNHTHSFSTTSNPGGHFHYTHYAGGQNGTGGTGGTGRLHNRAGDNVAAVTSSYNTGSDPRQDAEIGARSGNAADAGRSNSSGGHTHSGTTGNPSNRGTNSEGSAGDKSNLPPYYALAYIMKT